MRVAKWLLAATIALAPFASEGGCINPKDCNGGASAFVLSDFWYRLWPMRTFGTDQTGYIGTGQLQGWTQTDSGGVVHSNAADGSWKMTPTVANNASRTYHLGTVAFATGSTQQIATARFYFTNAAAATATSAFFGYCDSAHWAGTILTVGCSQYCGVYMNTSHALKWTASSAGSTLDNAADREESVTLVSSIADNEVHDFTIVLDEPTDTAICSLYMDGVLLGGASPFNSYWDPATATNVGFAVKSASTTMSMNVLGTAFYQRRY